MGIPHSPPPTIPIFPSTFPLHVIYISNSPGFEKKILPTPWWSGEQQIIERTTELVQIHRCQGSKECCCNIGVRRDHWASHGRGFSLYKLSDQKPKVNLNAQAWRQGHMTVICLWLILLDAFPDTLSLLTCGSIRFFLEQEAELYWQKMFPSLLFESPL